MLENKIMPRSPVRYPKSIIAIHWLTAAFVLGAWLTAKGGREVVQNPPMLHFALGIATLALVLPRLILRLAGGRIGSRPSNGWQAIAVKTGHGLLYLLLITLPISGWYTASLMGVPISFFGLELPAITAHVQGRPGLIAQFHENAGTLILVLAGLHALMAILHQFVLRDGTLARMRLR